MVNLKAHLPVSYQPLTVKHKFSRNGIGYGKKLDIEAQKKKFDISPGPIY